MIKFKRYPYRVGEKYGLEEGLTQRQITMAINKPVRQAKKLIKKAPLLEPVLQAEPLKDFDAEAEYKRRQASHDDFTQSIRNGHAEAWRKGRKRFFELDEATQKAVIERWERLTIKASIKMPATASNFCGIVDKMSGDQAKRIAKHEADFEAYKARQKQLEGEQLDFFGVA